MELLYVVLYIYMFIMMAGGSFFLLVMAWLDTKEYGKPRDWGTCLLWHAHGSVATWGATMIALGFGYSANPKAIGRYEEFYVSFVWLVAFLGSLFVALIMRAVERRRARRLVMQAA